MFRLSFKNLKELHKTLGGTRKGYFITISGMDTITGKHVRIDERIAVFVRTPSADVYLVKGTLL